MRVALALAPLLLTQAAYVYGVLRHGNRAAWRETAALGIALATGAGIALIAQTYHIESQRMFWRLWLWLVLPLPYLTGSWAAAFFAGFLAHVFAMTEPGFSFLAEQQQPLQWEYLAYLATLVPWVVWQAQDGRGYAAQSLPWRAFVNSQAMLALSVLIIRDGSDPFSLIVLCATAYLCCRAWCGDSVMGVFFAFALGIAYIMITDMGQTHAGPTYAVMIYAAVLLSAAALRRRRVALWS